MNRTTYFRLLAPTLAAAFLVSLPAATTPGEGGKKDAAVEKKQLAKLEQIPKNKIRLPDGVIYIRLPEGDVKMEHLLRNGNPVVRVSVGETVVTSRELFLGDEKGATKFEAFKDGIHWAPYSGKKGLMFGLGGAAVRKRGETLGDPDYFPLSKLKPGSAFLTTASLKFVFGKQAKPRPTGREGTTNAKPNVEHGFPLPEGVVHVTLPPGDWLKEHIVRDDHFLIGLMVNDAIIVETALLYFGDRTGAAKYRVRETGVEWVASSGRPGIDAVGWRGINYHTSGEAIGDRDFFSLDRIRAGELFVTTPSVRFVFRRDLKNYRFEYGPAVEIDDP